MPDFTLHAAWTLVVCFALSLVYELYRATAKAGTSRHDTPRMLLLQGVPLYGSAAVVIGLLFAGYGWATWVGLVYCVLLIGVSILYYNPVIMPERKPGLIDWVEDLLYTGLLFVAATMLIYALMTTE
jgi:phosphatidylserine synthase